MKPHHVLLALGAGVLWYEHNNNKKKRRKSNRAQATPKASPTTPDAPPPRPILDIAEDCESWTMSDAWIIQVAQPRFSALLRERVRGQMRGSAAEADPIGMTYRILEGEHSGCPAPLSTAQDGTVLRFDALQADIPGMPDHYPHAAILSLYAHITEAVLDALERFEVSGNPDELLFPL